MCVSLLGDGIFLVAMAWQVYALSNAPTALALVGITMTVPTIAFLLLGGVVSDRFDRRRVMVAADVLRGVGRRAHGAALAHRRPRAVAHRRARGGVRRRHGVLQPVLRRARARGAARRRAGPGQRARPVRAADRAAPGGAGARRRAHRAARRGHRLRARRGLVRGLGGRAAGHGAARRRAAAGRARHASRRDIARGPALRPQPRVAVGDVRQRRDRLPAVHGPGRGAAAVRGQERSARQRPRTSGIVFAAGGIGSVGCAVLLGQRGLPRRDITFMYLTWTLATLAVAGYGLATAVWQLMLASLAFNALETAGTIVWATAKQRHVPAALLGRVSSLDWLISIGLLPLSFALTGPVSGADRRADDADRGRRARRRRHLRRACCCRDARGRGRRRRRELRGSRARGARARRSPPPRRPRRSTRKASASERSGLSTLEDVDRAVDETT